MTTPLRRLLNAAPVPAIPAGGWRGSGRTVQRIVPPVPLARYTGKISGVPLTGGQASGPLSASGNLTLTVGPQGLGTTWYPASVTVSTSVGALDVATALVYLGIGGVPTQLLGTVYTGNGTVAVAVPPLQVGEFIIVTWTGGANGETASLNVVGTMDALTTARTS